MTNSTRPVGGTGAAASSPDADDEHLRLVAVFHYVVALLALLFSLIPIVHLVLGIAMVTGRFDGTDPPPPLVGWIFIGIAATWMLCGFVFSLCVLLAGRSLQQRRRYTFCLVMAGVETMFMPFGTALGVLTIIILVRPSVKVLFGSA